MNKALWLVSTSLCMARISLCASSLPVGLESKASSQEKMQQQLGAKGSMSLGILRGSEFMDPTFFSLEGAQLFMSYEPDEILLCDEESVKLSTAMLLAETIAIHKVSETLRGVFAFCDIYSEGLHFTPSSLTMQVNYSLEEEQRAICYLEEKINHIASFGITHADVQSYSQKLITLYDELLTDNPTDDQSYIYSLMEKEFFETGAMIPFKDFLHMARRYLSHIHVDEVAYALCRYLEPQNRVLESITADDLKDSDGSDGDATSEKKPSFDASLSGLLPRPAAERGGGFSSMKRGLSHTNSNSYGTREDFEQLPLSETDKKIIRKIISNMGEKNVFQLLLDKKDMEKMGKQIRNVHPLRFIGYILSESSLRRHLTTVSQSHFKWTGFMDGFKDRMKEEAKKGQLMPYLAGLCQLLNVASSSVAGYIQRGDYEGFVKHFI